MSKTLHFTIILGSVVVVAALYGIAVLWVGRSMETSEEDLVFYGEYGPALERDLGFRLGSPYIRAGGWKREVLTLERLRPNGAFFQAGIRNKDILIGSSTSSDFYRMLETSRGEEVSISVVSGGDGPSLSSRQVRTVRVRVPAGGERTPEVP